MIKVDINADVGEGVINEALLMPLLSSCNIACGGHAGNKATIQNVIKLAKKERVKIGVHPSFPDKENFGRLPMQLSNDALSESLKQQIHTFLDIANTEGVALHHIKPHGALYNLAAKDEQTAIIVLDVFDDLAKTVKLYAPFNSIIANLAKLRGIKVVYEAFLDRRYNEDLSLVNREHPKALITDENVLLQQFLVLKNHQKVVTLDGIEKSIKAETFCIHGDTKNSIELLTFLNHKLPEYHFELDKL